jgi:RNA polymerase sigma factor (sigma-70 family)
MTPILSSAILRTQSDARLLALASNGYERAFEAIVERYRRPLHRWCRTVLPEARAEDAVQTAFLKAWAALEGGAAVTDLKPWLYRIARNAALDNARKAGYDYDELSDALRLSPAPDDELERRTVIRETLTGVAGLPDNQRDALLRTAAGQSRAEIARDLHLSEGAVRQLVHRARTTLRAAVTAITPMPIVSWAAAFGGEAGNPAAQRIAELATSAGSAGIAATAVKAGTVVVAAGVLAASPVADLRQAVSNDDRPAAASAQPTAGGDGNGGGAAGTLATALGGPSAGTLGPAATGDRTSPRRAARRADDRSGADDSPEHRSEARRDRSDRRSESHRSEDRGRDRTQAPESPSGRRDHAPEPVEHPEPPPPPEPAEPAQAPEPPKPPKPAEHSRDAGRSPEPPPAPRE